MIVRFCSACPCMFCAALSARGELPRARAAVACGQALAAAMGVLYLGVMLLVAAARCGGCG